MLVSCTFSPLWTHSSLFRWLSCLYPPSLIISVTNAISVSSQGAWALGTCIGPVIGGCLATPSLWRWVFYLMFPFAAIGLVCVPLFVRLKPRKASWKEMVPRVDWIGGLLFISSATGFLIAVSWGGTQEPWNKLAQYYPVDSRSFGASRYHALGTIRSEPPVPPTLSIQTLVRGRCVFWCICPRVTGTSLPTCVSLSLRLPPNRVSVHPTSRTFISDCHLRKL